MKIGQVEFDVFAMRVPPIIGKDAKACGFPPLFMDCQGQITIGENTFFGHGVKILTGFHDYTRHGMDRQDAIITKPVTIGNGVWIASFAIILPGVTIGDNAVIGAGSVVTHDVEANTLVAGNPVKLIRHI